MHPQKLSKDEAIGFRDQLREARLRALKDAEAFDEVVFVLERLGRFLLRHAEGPFKKWPRGLDQYRPFIEELAECSPLHRTPGANGRASRTPFAQFLRVGTTGEKRFNA